MSLLAGVLGFPGPLRSWGGGWGFVAMPIVTLLCKLPRCRWHLLHSSKDASDIIAGRFPKYGVLPNVYGSPATWNADLTIVSSMNMALHVGAEVTLRTLGTCLLYRRLLTHSSGLVAGCAGELPDARDAVRAPNPGAA